jgi:hypothetical protein
MLQTVGRVPVRLVAAGLMVVGLGIAVFGGLLLLSAANAHTAHRFLSEWEKAGREPAPEAFAAAEVAAIRAIRLFPGVTGEGWDRLGRVYDWAHWLEPIVDQPQPSAPMPPARILSTPVGAAGAADPRTTQQRALHAYQRAVALRPLWPYGMARLAFARLRAGATDESLDGAMREAFRLGPWRPSVNRRLTEIGLLGWRWLDPETRDLVLENARRTVRFSRSDERWVLNLADATGKRLIIETLVRP